MTRAYVKFNNNARDYMVRGAMDFCGCLGLPVPDLEALRTQYRASHPEPPPRPRRARPRFFFPQGEKAHQIRLDEQPPGEGRPGS